MTTLSTAAITNNVIIAGHASGGMSLGLEQTGAGPLTITNNTISSGSSPILSAAVQVGGAVQFVLANNIVMTRGTAPIRAGINANVPGELPSSLQHNLVLDAPTALLRRAVANGGNCNLSTTNRFTCHTAIADLNDASLVTGGSVVSAAANVTVASVDSVAFAAFPTDLHLTAGTPSEVRAGGKDASTATCGYWGDSSCGAVTLDADDAPRTCPIPGSDCYSIGAYELD